MAGVYTDNQPDFSFLQPGETKTWSQYWYPIQKIGPAQQANLEAAISLQVNQQQARIGVAVRPLVKVLNDRQKTDAIALCQEMGLGQLLAVLI